MADKGARVIIITKKVKGHAAHHGGAWKVAYADFVTALMALFMVLWLVSQTDDSTKQQLSQYFRTGMFSGAPSVLMGGTGISGSGFLDAAGGVLQFEQRNLSDGAESIKQALAKAVKANALVSEMAKEVDVQVTDQGLLIQILDGGDDLLFDLSSSELKPRLKELLSLIAPVLGTLSNQIQLHGHTDARPFPSGATRSNWDLSYERANSARSVLEASGLRPGQVSGVFAHGSSSPFVKNDPFSSRNRRLAILAVRRGAEDTVTRGVNVPSDTKLQPPRATGAPSATQTKGPVLRLRQPSLDTAKPKP